MASSSPLLSTVVVTSTSRSLGVSSITSPGSPTDPDSSTSRRRAAGPSGCRRAQPSRQRQDLRWHPRCKRRERAVGTSPHASRRSRPCPRAHRRRATARRLAAARRRVARPGLRSGWRSGTRFSPGWGGFDGGVYVSRPRYWADWSAAHSALTLQTPERSHPFRTFPGCCAVSLVGGGRERWLLVSHT